MYHSLGHIKYIIRSNKISERELAEKSGLSRGTIRSILYGNQNYKLNSLIHLLDVLNAKVDVLTYVDVGNSDCSTAAVSANILHDGFESWKLHLMNFVDEFRRSKDVRLVMLEPSMKLDRKLAALIASTTIELCHEIGLEIPRWANRNFFLKSPWFISGSDALKPMAILESPLAFRRNNIFVHDNFLFRA